MTSETIPAAAALDHIERLAKAYSEARATLAERVESLNRELRAAESRRLPWIKTAHAAAADAQATLVAAILERPDLFVKPRTLTLHGIKLGFQKGKGRTLWPEAAKLIALIKRTFAPSTVGRLVDTVEVPNRDAILQLPAPELKKLGVVIDGTTDQVFVKTSDTAIDKIVSALLKEGAVEESA